MIDLLLAIAASSSAPYTCDQIKTDDLIACAYSKYKKADATMNAQWKAMDHWPKVLRSQRAWLVYRDVECEAANPASPDGREYPVHKYLCLAELTDERVSRLREIAAR